jgi:hypothetical protein
MTLQEIAEINNAIRSSHAKWKATETSITKIRRPDRLKYLGFVPGPRDKSLQKDYQRLISRRFVQVQLRLLEFQLHMTFETWVVKIL